MPEDYSGCDGDVEGMLGAELRDFESEVRGIHDILGHALYLVAEDEGVFVAIIEIRDELVKWHRVNGLFDADRCIALPVKFGDCVQRAVGIFPRHAVFRSKR